MITEKRLLKISGKYTLIGLAISLFCWFVVFDLGICYAQTQTGYRIPARLDIGGGRMTGDMWMQAGTSGVRLIIGTQTVTQVGTTGVITGTTAALLPRLDFTTASGSTSVNFNGFGAVYIDSVAIPSAGSVTGKINIAGGTGTTNVFTNTTLAGLGTITASFAANGLVISPAEYSTVNNATGELQSQITTATGSITNHAHTGSDGTTQVSHTNLTNKGTQTHTQIDNFIASKASASGVASLDANSLVVQNPASGTSTPGTSKTVMSDGTGKILDGWLSNNVTKLGTPTTNNISEGSTNKYYTDARVTSAVGSLSVNVLSDVNIIFNENDFVKIVGGQLVAGSSTATVAFAEVTGSATASQLPLSLAGMTFTGNTNFPSGSWNSSGNVAIGTTTATHLFSVVSGTNIVKYTTAGNMRMGSIGDSEAYDGKLTITGASAAPGDEGALFKIRATSGDEIGFGVYDSPTARDIGWISAFHPGIDNCDLALQPTGRNVAIGTNTAGNILTLPIASATDPIADAWINYCLADYKDIGTETTEMIQVSANEKIKSVPVSLFTKKAMITDEEAERKPKQKYQTAIRESAKADLELYTAETGVAMNNNSYVNELVNSMWETKSDRLTIVEANKQKLIAEKKALPKFQRKNYGIVAEDAPPEAQVLREDGSLQGVDTSVLVGILWANSQKQEERISALESEIDNLYIIIEVLAVILGVGGSATWLAQRRKRNG